MLANANGWTMNKNKRAKKHFTEEEDQTIKHFVHIIGSKKWSFIAKFVPGRTAKQCRDRYMNNLKPELLKVEWSQNDDNLLIDLFSKHGPKWSIISKHFNNRNQVSIKNRLLFLQKNHFFFNERKNNDDAINTDEKFKNDKIEENGDDLNNLNNINLNDKLITKSERDTYENEKRENDFKEELDDSVEIDQFFDENLFFNFDEIENL